MSWIEEKASTSTICVFGFGGIKGAKISTSRGSGVGRNNAEMRQSGVATALWPERTLWQLGRRKCEGGNARTCFAGWKVNSPATKQQQTSSEETYIKARRGGDRGEVLGPVAIPMVSRVSLECGRRGGRPSPPAAAATLQRASIPAPDDEDFTLAAGGRYPWGCEPSLWFVVDALVAPGRPMPPEPACGREGTDSVPWHGG